MTTFQEFGDGNDMIWAFHLAKNRAAVSCRQKLLTIRQRRGEGRHRRNDSQTVREGGIGSTKYCKFQIHKRFVHPIDGGRASPSLSKCPGEIVIEVKLQGTNPVSSIACAVSAHNHFAWPHARIKTAAGILREIRDGVSWNTSGNGKMSPGFETRHLDRFYTIVIHTSRG